jgi:CheY-like chemotaxis protein
MSIVNPRVLIVDDQRDILRLIHSTLDTLGHKLDIFEAPSGEEALLEISHHPVDLLISDYKLPGITGVELMKKVRVKIPDVKVVLITAMTDKRTRDEMLSAGATALFDKPIPLADFLDSVERILDLRRTILPPEDERLRANRQTLAELMTSLRKKINAQAVFLVSDRGRVLERAGNLYDGSMEVSMLSAVTAIFGAGQRVSRLMHQDGGQYHVFSGGDQDLLLIPISSLYGLLVAGQGLAARQRLADVLEAILFVRAEMEKSLKSMGMPTTPVEANESEIVQMVSASVNVPTQDIDDLLTKVKDQHIKPSEADAFWDEAVEKHGNPPLKPDVISYEQAKRLGLTPSQSKTKPKK